MSTEFNITHNGSLFNDDIYSDAEDEKSYLSVRAFFGHFYMVAVIVKLLLLAPLALASDIYLIVIIRKFPNLRNRINNFILQYAIFNILYTIQAALLDVTMDLYGVLDASIILYNSLCFIDNLDHLALTLNFYALSYMALDWYISNCHSKSYGTYPTIFKYGVYIMYAFAVPKWIVTSTICYMNRLQVDMIKTHWDLVSFFLCLVIVLSITIFKRRKVLSSEACKTEYALIIPRMVLLSALFMFCIRLSAVFIEDDNMANINIQILYLLHMVAECVFLAMPAVIVYQLAKLNKRFKSAYLKCFKKKSVENYEDDNLDEDSVSNTPCNVTFDRGSEVINF